MIRFKCEHCGWPVRVPPAHAGKTGRCPSCRALVQIPAQDDEQAEVAQLAQALRERGDRSDQSPGHPPPPPLPEYRIDNDDVELQPEDASHKTDIIPAEELLSAAEAKKRRRAARQAARQAAQAPHAAHHPPAARGGRLRLFILLAIGLVVLTVAVAAYFIFARS